MSSINPNNIKQGILDYRAEGKRLMEMLGKKFGYDISIPGQFEELIWKGNKKVPNYGALTRYWDYNLRGSKCHFINNLNEQTVVVHYINPPEFGFINEWHLLLFLETTNKYKKSVQNCDWNDLKPIVGQLYRDGEI